jgi:hypothetical protein
METENIDEKFMKQLAEEGTTFEEGNTLDDTKSIQEELLSTEWIEEARQIPLDMVTSLEKHYLTQYLNKEILDDEEKEILSTILEKYRPAIQKVQPGEVLENLEGNTRIVEDEKAFLEYCDEFEKVQVIPFTFYQGSNCYRMKFDLYPLTDSEAITSIGDNLAMFKDFSDEELQTYNKIQNGDNLTREEIIIRAGLEQKIQQATQKNQRQTIVEFLTLQLKFHNKDSSPDDMRRVFQHMPFAYLALLFQEVQNRSHLGDTRLENVFQDFE